MEKALRYTFVSDLSKTHCFTNPEAYKQKNVGKTKTNLLFKLSKGDNEESVVSSVN